MIEVDSLAFKPRNPEDPDIRCLAVFDFCAGGILFRSWKIRRKEDGNLSISPPYAKYGGVAKHDTVHFTDIEDFRHIRRTVIQAARETGFI